MEDIIIREAQEKDAEQLLLFMKQVGGESDNLTFGPEGLPFSVEEEKEFIKATKEDEHSVMYLAFLGETIIGDVSLRGLPRRMSHRCEMGISVAKSHWNKGVGSALLDKAVAYAKSHDAKIINLEVKQDNLGAIHLYEKFGFQRIGTSPAFHKIGDEYVDFELMYLDLRD